ncbi:MAG: hypothetical protein QF830_08265 [Rhodospirillales bacterium]|nr:hypothetical protein [Rhodospirillales bacterium]MDP6884115.1 hypothetical protein [Rhodospirillales bacterium]
MPIATSRPDPFCGERLFADVETYSGFGEQRTGGTADARTADWIAGRLATAGLTVRRQPFQVRQFFPTTWGLSLGGVQIPCFPPWWPAGGGAEAINAALVDGGRAGPDTSVRGAIVLFRFRLGPRVLVSDEQRTRITVMAQAGAQAAVIITESPTGDLLIPNVAPDDEPWPLPLLAVGERHAGFLEKAAAEGRPARLVLDGYIDERASTSNVVAHTGGGRRRIVISTPRTGWFASGGERGPGIAYLLALAEWAVERRSGVGFVFVATAGHELDHLGMTHFLSDYPPTPEQTLCWLHLGAGIATRRWAATARGLSPTEETDGERSLYCSPDLVEVLGDVFGELPGLEPVVPEPPLRGELENVRRAGYKDYATVVGLHPFHHAPSDGPGTTTGAILEATGRAFPRFLERLIGNARNGDLR